MKIRTLTAAVAFALAAPIVLADRLESLPPIDLAPAADLVRDGDYAFGRLDTNAITGAKRAIGSAWVVVTNEFRAYRYAGAATIATSATNTALRVPTLQHITLDFGTAGQIAAVGYPDVGTRAYPGACLLTMAVDAQFENSNSWLVRDERRVQVGGELTFRFVANTCTGEVDYELVDAAIRW